MADINITSVAIFLGDLLGIDLRGFFDWLGLALDVEKAKETQAVCMILMRVNLCPT